uniref:Uncharacterized protein n=1 Tax=Amphimedon queenslandica TaxID=400682 RepID=A0A1X7VKW2_AMPQE
MSQFMIVGLVGMMILLNVQRSKLLLFVSAKKLQYLFVQKMYRGKREQMIVVFLLRHLPHQNAWEKIQA